VKPKNPFVSVRDEGILRVTTLVCLPKKQARSKPITVAAAASYSCHTFSEQNSEASFASLFCPLTPTDGSL